ncbi:MAG TPA: cytochrome d ubiquinol oxidase subunit II [Acidobacteriota bacterium]|nr:cytochrome d ubiquinol oxidase subunit II [Acidobacteriota bacterium]
METLWFCLLAWMLATYVVLDGFDLGAGLLHPFVARTEAERQQIVRSLGPVWDGNEVWLLAAGGTMFLAFPTLLGTAFSGFYLPLMIVLWLLIFRALGIELRHQLHDSMWTQFWDYAFAVSSFLLAVCFGAALGNVVRGVPLGPDGTFFEPLWTDFRVGARTGILDWYTVLIGLTAVAALAQHGALWLASRTDGPVQERSRRLVSRLWPLTIVLALLTTIATFSVQPLIVQSLSDRPWGVVFALLAAGGLAGIYAFRRRAVAESTEESKRRASLRAFLSSAAFLYGMLALVGVGLYPYLLPARDPALGLTAQTAAAGGAGLTTALYWWIPGMILAVGYFTYLYGSLPSCFSVHDPGEH